MPIIEVEGLRKVYGDTLAVDGASFAVEQDEIFGILGPNGAGKTTTVECLLGLRIPDAGSMRVLGLDPLLDGPRLHARVGAQLQESALPNRLKVGEALELYASFYPHPADPAELLGALDLTGKRDAYFKKLSGGQKQRLSIALALIGRPEVAVLDELTAGLDPQARRDSWQLIEDVRARGVTIVLVTHFMEEAERLCDRVALFDRGRIVAVDTPEGLAARVREGQRMRFIPSAVFQDPVLTSLPEVSRMERDGDHVIVWGSGELVSAVILALDRAGVSTRDLRVEAPSLEDAFVRFTGRGAARDPGGAT